MCALDGPIRERAGKLQALVFAITLSFDETALNLDDGVADVLMATLVMHYPDMLFLSDQSAFIVWMREAMAARAIGEPEVLAWSETIRRAFTPPPPKVESSANGAQSEAAVVLLKRQSEQIDIIILQNKRLDE
ncbi:hypothetical protein PHYSODRAFT_248230 [Phytophthora sojae]|uniref:Uncharacterized protein n=1 Tax=Phytophthora sojae (strain P6497) TaxID=1094619 RepID=G4YG72_PHYSP|nr:hypothetical protein PHYSODRAFT_248230 [Phytophthora sojae]EGZ28684.1 hypothetical protein PHYSODRAFT_248230 [Phytophthora sojae]|eukprot:XP_009515959.1 hypothetical protein PHYSODRAFT_248230 [Phytophthora sojae]